MSQRSSGAHVAAAAAIAVMATLVGACSGTPATSTVTGTLEQQSFASPVKKLTVDSGAVRTTVPVDAAGRFAVTLDKGASYQLLVAQPSGDVPIVLRRGAGRLDTTVTVKAGGARVDLGKVTYWKSDAAVSPPAPVQVAAQECDDGEEADDSGVDCVDGIDSATGQACDGGPGANQNDGEVNDSEVEDTDCSASDAMGLPDNDMPDTLGCGDGDGEEDDD